MHWNDIKEYIMYLVGMTAICIIGLGVYGLWLFAAQLLCHLG